LNGLKPDKGINKIMIEKLVLQLKLIVRLINILLKLIPLFAIIYFIFPDPFPFPIPDDLGVIIVGFTLFIQLCPPAIVAEHMAALQQGIPGTWKDPKESGEVIDVGFNELDPKKDSDQKPPKVQ
jgi:hypothetical protein